MDIDIMAEWSKISGQLAQANLPQQLLTSLGQFDQILQLIVGQKKLSDTASDVAASSHATIQSIRQDYEQQISLLTSKIESLQSQLSVLQSQKQNLSLQLDELSARQNNPPPDNIISTIQEQLANTLALNDMLSQQNTQLQQEIDRQRMAMMGQRQDF